MHSKNSENLSYQQIKNLIEQSNKKEEQRARVLAAKRAERQSVKNAGGGVAIAKQILERSQTYSDSTDFAFGYNTDIRTSDNNSENDEQLDGCMGQVCCKKCGKFHGYCREVAEDKEKLKMLPSGEQTTTKSNRKGGLNWIKPEMLSTQPKEAKILMVRYQEQGQWGARVNLKLAFDGEIAYLGVSPTKKDPRYKVLIETFGTMENDWVDQRITLFLEQDQFTEAFQIRIGVVADKKGKK